FDLVVRARSLNDTLVTNATIDRLVPPAAVAPGAALVLEQAFREAVVSVGDVATLVITVRNVTDSLRVDNVVVTEFAQAQLDFSGSPDFSWNGSALLWNAGTLAGGESKQTVVKFVVNSRVAHGNAKAIGNASGTAISNNTVNATPVISLVKIDNDIFSAEGLIFGEVFVDSDGNGRRDEGEIGVPGAAVYLESGEYAITDSTGTYSLPRIFSGYRIVRLDEESLPADVVFAQPLTGGQGRRGNEQIAHLLPGGHARVSFPLAEPPPAMIDVTHTMSLQERVSVTKQARLYQAFVMPSSYFAPGKAKLIVGATRDMRPIVEFLEEHPDWRVLVEGHTDSTPIRTRRFPSNHELSLARASDVRDYLSTSGVSNGRILVVGHGESRPIATNGTVEGRSINRRVEISFIPPDVKISEHDSLQRVPGTIRDLSILPDTFHVNVVWELITTVDAPAEGALRLHIPRNFENPDVRVQLGEKTLALEDDEYRFAGFARGHPLSVKIMFRSSSPDTSHIRDIRGVLSFDHHPAAAPATSSPASGQRYPLSPITLQPHEAGSSSRVTTQSDLIEWRSEESLVGPKQGTNPTAPVDAQPPIVVQPDEQQDGGPVTLLSPVDGTIFAHRDQIQVRARIPIGARAELFVGGSPIDQDRLGRRVIDTQAGEEILSWFGVRIAGGWNTIEVRASVPGQATDADTITVALSAQPRSVVALQKSQIIEADGHSRVPVRFAVRDGYALPVMDGIVATVIEGSEFVEARDARPSERGLQLVTASGFVDILTRPRGETGRGRVVIECQGMRAETELIWVSPRRPFLATGVIDVNVGVFTTSGDGDPLGVENFTDGFDVQAESRLFLQGPVMHGASLT
ncbi:MAG: OmpA family protein, partial [Candidatus Krumholzibacteriota bacterium]|nr:OmpA family protein [Candidatus Krumholzibacteriota bacterium]